MHVWLFIILLFAILAITITAEAAIDKRKIRNMSYHEVYRGVYDYIRMASDDGKGGGGVTMVHFQDGRTVTLPGFQSVPVPRGKLVRIMSNGHRYKIEAVENQP